MLDVKLPVLTTIPHDLSEAVNQRAAPVKRRVSKRRANPDEIRAAIVGLLRPEPKPISRRKSKGVFFAFGNQMETVQRAYSIVNEQMKNPQNDKTKGKILLNLADVLNATRAIIEPRSSFTNMILTAPAQVRSKLGIFSNFVDFLLDFAEEIMASKYANYLKVPKKASLDEDLEPVVIRLALAEKEFLIAFRNWMSKLKEGSADLLTSQQALRFRRFFNMGRNGEHYHHSSVFRPIFNSDNSAASSSNRVETQSWAGLFTETYRERILTKVKAVTIYALQRYGQDLEELGYLYKTNAGGKVAGEYNVLEIENMKIAKLEKHLQDLEKIASMSVQRGLANDAAVQTQVPAMFKDLRELVGLVDQSSDLQDLKELAFEVQDTLEDIFDHLGLIISDHKEDLYLGLDGFAADTVAWTGLAADNGLQNLAEI